MGTGKKEVSGVLKVLAVIVYLVMICAGVYLFFNLRGIVWIFAAAVAIQGVLMIVKYIHAKEYRNGWDLLVGLISILFGAIMLFGGTETRVAGVVTIELFISIWVVCAGFSQTFGSFALKSHGVKNWGWVLAGGILTIICGIVFISMPLMSSALFVGITGIYAGVSFVVVGVTGIAAALSGSKKN